MTKKRIVAAAVTLCVLALWTGGSAVAQMDQPAIPQWAAIVHQLALNDSSAGFFSTVPTGVFPPLIPEYLPSLDPSGVVETYNLSAPTLTAKNAFFKVWAPMAELAPLAMNPEAHGALVRHQSTSVSTRVMGQIRFSVQWTERLVIQMT
jgi:hypothetical protein